MANITVKDLAEYNIAGSDTFNNLISFVRDLSDDELDFNRGGWSFWCWVTGRCGGGSGGSRN
jgi:hypothetical protein